MPRLGECQQGMRIATFEHDRRLQSRHPAGCIECPAKSESAVQEKQRKPGKIELSPWYDWDQVTSRDGKPPATPPIQAEGLPKCCSFSSDCVQQVLAEMDFPAFEHCQYFAARTLPDPYSTLGYRFAYRWRNRDSTLSMCCGDPAILESLCLHDGAIGPAPSGELTQLSRRRQPAINCSPSPVKEAGARPCRRAASPAPARDHDLPGQSRLGDRNRKARFRDGAELGHGQEREGLSKVHVRLYHSGIKSQRIYVLDEIWTPVELFLSGDACGRAKHERRPT